MQRDPITTPQHTPTPWKVYHWHPDNREIAYIGPDGLDDTEYRCDAIATLFWTPLDNAAANADLIVRAVNSHAALVEALEGLISTAETRDRQAIEDALIHGRAALAAAKVTK